MREYFSRHPAQKWSALVAAALILTLTGFLLLFDWNLLRPWIARTLSQKTRHEVRIGGDLRVHPWSLEPRVSIEGLSIRNPAWAKRREAFGAARIMLQISLPNLLRGDLLLPEVVLTQPRLDYEVRADGSSNWQPGGASATGKPRPQPVKLPAIRRLLIDRGEVHVDDRLRKLQAHANVHADEKAAAADAHPFEIHGDGAINGRRFTVLAQGSALVDIDPQVPYPLQVSLRAGDIAADVRLSIDKPFDLSAFQSSFDVSGNDLADAYYLTGLALPNTTHYSVGGSLRRDGALFSVRGLRGTVGRSDLQGDLTIDNAGDRPKVTANLTSTRLNLGDLVPALGARKAQLPIPGAKAHAGAPPPTAPSLFPDADLQLERVRGMDADVSFNGASVTAGIPVREVHLRALLDHGLLRLQPLSILLQQGRLSGRALIDARRADPESQIDLSLSEADLSQLKSRDARESPLSGPVRGRLRLHGYGTSVHKFVSHMDGNINAVTPHGEMRSAFAELTGINVAKALGLLLTKHDDRTELRCAVAAFQAKDGQLSANTLLIDTTHVLITGQGGIDLANERVDLQIEGKPKSPRMLRLRSPIHIHGRLRRPQVGIEAGKPLLQAGAATVLGVLLTPVAAALAFIDPGLEKDADCAGALASAAGGARAR